MANKQKVYAIRKNELGYYDDPYHVVETPEGVSDPSILLTRDASVAKAKFEECERAAYRKLSDHCMSNLFFVIQDWESFEEQTGKIEAYFKKEFPDAKYKPPKNYEFNLRIPKSATDEQIDGLRELIPFEIHSIVEFKEDPTQFQAKVNRNLNSDKKASFKKLDPVFLTREAAENFAIVKLIEAISIFDCGSWSFAIQGSPEDLSETPAIMRQVVEDNQWLSFDETETEIRCERLDGEDIEWGGFGITEVVNQFKAFFMLFKEKTIAIVESQIG